MHQREPAGIKRHQRLAARDRIGIAVDAEHAAIAGFQHGARITAAAEGAVDVMGAVARVQRFQHFGQHDREVAAHDAPPLALKAASARLQARRAHFLEALPAPRSGIGAHADEQRRGP